MSVNSNQSDCISNLNPEIEEDCEIEKIQENHEQNTCYFLSRDFKPELQVNVNLHRLLKKLKLIRHNPQEM